MKLEEVPSGSRILIDANILIYARRGMSLESRRFLARCAAGDLRGVLTTTCLAEFCHRRMIQEAQSKGLAGSNPARALAGRPDIVQSLTEYQKDMDELLAGDFEVLTVTAALIRDSLRLQRSHGLLTNDSNMLAAAFAAGINTMATSDPQFETVSELQVFRPQDI